MAQVKCPDCGKVVNPEEGYCMYCGYTFDDGQIKSPFASSAFTQGTSSVSDESSVGVSQPAYQEQGETSGGSPVIRFDAGSYSDSMPS